MIVVPMPEVSASVDARSCTRRFASWISCTTMRFAAAVAAGLVQRVGGERRGDLAGARAAHAVGDREERRLEDVRVLVVVPLAARVGADLLLADLRVTAHGSNLRSVSPTRTTSPGASRRSRVRRMPLTNVPFVEPMSST